MSMDIPISMMHLPRIFTGYTIKMENTISRNWSHHLTPGELHRYIRDMKMEDLSSVIMMVGM